MFIGALPIASPTPAARSTTSHRPWGQCTGSAAHTPADGGSYMDTHEHGPRWTGGGGALWRHRAGAVIWGMGSVCWWSGRLASTLHTSHTPPTAATECDPRCA